MREYNNYKLAPAQVVAWLPMERKWPREDLNEHKQLKVYMENFPVKWKFRDEEISKEVIMELVNDSWSGCFIAHDNREGCDIHVTFQATSMKKTRWSAVGNEAKLLTPLAEPTMILDFTDMNDDQIKSTVLHQFGHALGLGHALMKPEDWTVLKPYLNVNEMMKSFATENLTLEDFEVQWTGKNMKNSVVNYDDESIMGYSTNPLWLKEAGYQNPHSVEWSNLPSDVQKKLTVFHKHSTQQTSLSCADKDTLQMIKGGLGTDYKYPQIMFFNVSATARITSSGISIDRLEDMGISMLVPEGSISSVDKHIYLRIRPCFSGPFQLPPEYEPASPTYLITHSKKINFLKDVTVRIQHYVQLETKDDCEDMAFFSASSNPEYTEGNKPVYTFKKICGANTIFRKGEQVGEIALRHFCLMKKGKRKSSSERDPLQSKKKYKDSHLYSANLYPVIQHENNILAIFCMCQCTSLHMKLCDDIIGELFTGIKLELKTTVSGIITGDEVEVKSVCTGDQEIMFDRLPAKILKEQIDIPNIEVTDISQLKCIYPPKLKIHYVRRPNLSIASVKIIGMDTEHTLNIVQNLSVVLSPRERPQVVLPNLCDVDDRDLEINDDLVEVLAAVRPLTSKWKDLLTQLHIDQELLEVIDRDNPRKSHSCLRAALSEWLHMNYDYERHGRPSWKRLAEAVSNIDKRLSEKIIIDHTSTNFH